MNQSDTNIHQTQYQNKTKINPCFTTSNTFRNCKPGALQIQTKRPQFESKILSARIKQVKIQTYTISKIIATTPNSPSKIYKVNHVQKNKQILADAKSLPLSCQQRDIRLSSQASRARLSPKNKVSQVSPRQVYSPKVVRIKCEFPNGEPKIKRKLSGVPLWNKGKSTARSCSAITEIIQNIKKLKKSQQPLNPLCGHSYTQNIDDHNQHQLLVFEDYLIRNSFTVKQPQSSRESTRKKIFFNPNAMAGSIDCKQNRRTGSNIDSPRRLTIDQMFDNEKIERWNLHDSFEEL